MYLQVKNTTKENFNQFQSTKKTVVKDIKSRGWKISDCSITEIREELIESKYKGADGKNVGGVSRQYVTRAKSKNTLNKKNTEPKKKESLIIS